MRVLRDSLFAGRGGSNMLLPRIDLGALLPEPAAAWLQTRGHAVRLGRRVQALARAEVGAGWLVDGEGFDAVVLATSSSEAARLTGAADVPGGEAAAVHAWADTAQALRFGAIATVYAQAPARSGSALLAAPMLALRSGPAQFVFDRGQLDGTHGLLAFVVSAFEGERESLEQEVLAQAAHELGLQNISVVQTIVERRATFLCTPQLARPPLVVARGLLACGDYVAGPYPATLEGAVLHAAAAAAVLNEMDRLPLPRNDLLLSVQ